MGRGQRYGPPIGCAVLPGLGCVTFCRFLCCAESHDKTTKLGGYGMGIITRNDYPIQKYDCFTGCRSGGEPGLACAVGIHHVGDSCILKGSHLFCLESLYC